MNKRKTGMNYERLAGEFLRKQGYRIMEYNFYSRRGEIDIVARDGSYLVFVEVKYREDIRDGDPLEAVDLKKQRRICLTAMYYLAVHRLGPDTACRFDVVAVTGNELQLVQNAFPMINL